MIEIEIQSLKSAIADYEAARDRVAAAVGLVPVKAKAKPKTRRWSARAKRIKAKANGNGISAAQKSVRQLQGQYMGVIRNLGAASKERVKKERAAKGVKAAIALAKKLQ